MSKSRDAVEDIRTIDTVTATANAALPKAGGALTGAITTNSTFDGVDIATRDGVLTTTTTTANAALPKAGGSLTGVVDLNNNNAYFKGNATHGYRFNSASDAANLFTIYDSGDTKIFAGDLVFGTAGKGIVLGATTNVDANTLDDYEEGTATISYTPASGSITMFYNTARYVKIGQLVFMEFSLSCNGASSPSGTVKLTGLPFTANGTGGLGVAGTGGAFGGYQFPTDQTNVTVYNGSTEAYITDATSNYLQASEMGFGYNAGQGGFSFTYRTNS